MSQFLEFETKEDSAAKLAANVGTPTKYYLSADEIMLIVKRINELSVTVSNKEEKLNKTSDVSGNLTSITKIPTVKGIVDWVIANIQGTPNLGAITPASVPTGTGAACWFTFAPGTYASFGGIIVNANSAAVIVRDNIGNFTVSQTAFDFSTYLQTNEAKLNYLDLLNLQVDNVVEKPIFLRPYNKFAETFTTGTTIVSTSATYYETTNKVVKSNNEVLKKVHIYSNGTGTVAIKFAKIISNVGFIEHSINKSVVAGWNQFVFSDTEIPSYVTDLDEYYICLTLVTAGLLKYKATPVGTLAVFGINASGGAVTVTTNTLGCYIEVQQMTETVLETYPKTKIRRPD